MSPQINYSVLATALIVIVLIALAVVGVVAAARAARKARGRADLRRGPLSTRDDTLKLPAPWRALRREVEMYNRTLPPAVFQRIRRLFLDYYASGQLTPASLTREWEKEEFLLVVDEHGRPMAPVREMVERFAQTAGAHPAFRGWFREEVFQEGRWAGVPTLLAARWLCHLAGLRHKTVEIFLDPPDLPGHTLAQVRGMEKFEAPGAFDIPCAGHVSGMESDQSALEKELREELNLSLDQLEDLRLLERYNSYSEDAGAEDAGANEGAENGGETQHRHERRALNNEHRVLYQARLKAGSAAQVRFSDGEVAGLGVFSVAELRELVRKHPERVASGLADAMGFYKEDAVRDDAARDYAARDDAGVKARAQ